MKEYIAKGWIHSKNGGDDLIFFKAIINSENEEKARISVQKWLKKRSSIITDFVIKEQETKKCV